MKQRLLVLLFVVQVFVLSPSLFAETSPKEGYCSYLWEKILQLRYLDYSHLIATRLRTEIMLKTKTKRIIDVRLKDLKMIHPINYAEALDKLNKRIEDVESHQDEILEKGVIDLNLQDQILSSKNYIRVVRDMDGRYVVFDGNGRYFAVRQALLNNDEVKISVELFDVETPALYYLLKRIREERPDVEELNELPLNQMNEVKFEP